MEESKNTTEELTDEFIEKLQLGKRVELNEKTATIKYVGPLKHKKDAKENEIWLGLEWDEKERGKHNGTVEGYEYFKTTDNKNSGSLIKMTKVNIGQTFKGALGYKYNFYEEEGMITTKM